MTISPSPAQTLHKSPSTLSRWWARHRRWAVKWLPSWRMARSTQPWSSNLALAPAQSQACSSEHQRTSMYNFHTILFSYILLNLIYMYNKVNNFKLKGYMYYLHIDSLNFLLPENVRKWGFMKQMLRTRTKNIMQGSFWKYFVFSRTSFSSGRYILWFVLSVPKFTANLYLSRCSTDLL